MFVDDEFGPRSPANTPYSSLSIDGTRLEVYLSRDDNERYDKPKHTPSGYN